MQLGWITDPHLNFVDDHERNQFYTQLTKSGCDAFVICGDIGEAHSVEGYLRELDQVLKVPLYFVLGNHDFYFGSVFKVQCRMGELYDEFERVRWLPEAGVVKLTPTTCLIGHSGWADGRLGDYAGSDVLLSDYFVIHEFCDPDRPIPLAKERRLEVLHTMADQTAEFFAQTVPEALQAYEHVIVANHVPPFREARKQAPTEG